MRLQQQHGTTTTSARLRTHQSMTAENILASRWLRPALIMFGCYLIGYLQGSGLVGLFSPLATTTTTDDGALPWRASDAATTTSRLPSKTTASQRNDSGWTSIDVFYGTRNHLDLRNRTWFSQARQDELISALLRHKRNGYFIDLAANDAVDLSNSLALERRYDWQGLCIEPNPRYWKNLTYRHCQTVGAIVGATRDEHVYFRFQAGEYGGIAAEGFDNNARWQRESVLQSTVTLHEIFQRYHVPREIDYLSLDVEGAETFIMMAFPLQDYRIKLITAERLRGPIRHFLKNHSYEFVQRLTSWGESLWVHTDVKPLLVCLHACVRRCLYVFGFSQKSRFFCFAFHQNWTAMQDFNFPMF